MCSQFSKDGKYYAQISTDGKLRIWNVLTNTFEQEFTPDFHLTSPCASLHFINQDSINTAASPKKKKRRNSQTNPVPAIVLGTSNGHLLCYSIIKATIDYTINSETSLSINCLSSQNDDCVYSGADTNILVWSLHKKRVQTKWNTGTEKICSILKIPGGNHLLTASRQIILWDDLSKEKLGIYTGHSSDVCLLNYVNLKNTDGYFISGAKDDRLLSCWNLCEESDSRQATVRFLMEDTVHSLSVFINTNNIINVAATLKSGIVHVYEQTLNGISNKPIKAKSSIQIVSDSGEDTAVTPIQICGGFFRDNKTLCIGYGGAFVKNFENITITTNKKIQCLIRKDPQKLATIKDNQVTNQQKPIVDNDVLYLTPHSSKTNATTKRKNDGQLEVPMERRLENLSLNKVDDMKVPKSDNVAQLLLQGLHSKDKNILRVVLSKQNEQIIKNTIKRLPMSVITQLVQELTNLIQGKTLASQIGCMWMKELITIHAGMLLSNPELNELFESTINKIESRLLLQTPLNRLKGRLDLLVSQMKTKSHPDMNSNDEVTMIFNDKDVDDSDDDLEMEAYSSSDHEWVEDSSEGEPEENGHNQEDKMEDDDDDDDNNDEDEEMST